MGSRGGGGREGSHRWSIFDCMKNIPTSPEALMAEINSAISSHEYARSTALLQNPSSSSSYSRSRVSSDGEETSQYDPVKADEAYRAGLASLAAGKLDNALNSLNIALSSCPPDKTSAVAKLESLISLTSQQLQKTFK